jgi:hypothetical protein
MAVNEITQNRPRRTDSNFESHSEARREETCKWKQEWARLIEERKVARGIGPKHEDLQDLLKKLFV